MKNKSFFFNLFIQYIIIIIIFAIIILTVSYGITKRNYINNLVDELKSNTVLLEEIVKNDLVKNDFNSINKKINLIGKRLTKRITIIKTNGYVVADSKEDYKRMSNHIDRPEIIEALNSKIGQAIRFSDTLKLNMLYVAAPIKYKNEIIGINRISICIKDINEIIRGFRTKILIITFFLIIIALIFAFFMSRKFTSPIKLLSDASKQVAKGDFNIKLYLNSNNEIKILTQNFNHMTLKLHDLFNELDYEKEELKSIITSMKEGIIIIDNSGKIIRTNSSFTELIDNKDVTDKYYWEIIRDSEIISFIKKFNINKKNIVKEIYYEDKILFCSINPLVSKKGFVLIFYDITELKNLENIKKDFISNVSHELRTPLTAIKGFAETLLEEEADKNKIKYLKIIERHTERLINIVADLLQLSNLEEDKKNKLDIEKVNIKTIVENVLVMFENRIKLKNLDIEIQIDDNLEKIECDSFKLEQIFINLIDNAIKYTDKGSIKILISSIDDKMVKIEIVDTGIGIPKKDISRVFERFYVVDKSRSKKNGGTGLGLSIVKHNVLLHNGDIKIYSRLNKGTSFIILFPINFNT
ncbi:MAG: HAMP domain-containing protein [Spirochaetes bacterium]|nr:HAMP domain-containing protein [Spirochaetota bacterium]